jgi:hypothetical protein
LKAASKDGCQPGSSHAAPYTAQSVAPKERPKPFDPMCMAKWESPPAAAGAEIKGVRRRTRMR